MENRNTLKYWETVAKWAIVEFLKQKQKQPFTAFLYEFAHSCSVSLGVMVDINDHNDKIYLTNHYYKFMHQLKEDIDGVKKNTVFRHKAKRRKVKAVA